MLAHSTVPKLICLRRIESKGKVCDKAVQQHRVLVKMFCQLTSYAVIVRETTEPGQSELHVTRAELGILQQLRILTRCAASPVPPAQVGHRI